MGASPSGPGHSAEPEPISVVSADTASVPSAVEAVRRFLEACAGVPVRIDRCSSRKWQSLTFAGWRHDAELWADDTASALRPVLQKLPDAELNVAGEIIADIGIQGSVENVPTWGGCAFVVEVLSIHEDCEAGDAQ